MQIALFKMAWSKTTRIKLMLGIDMLFFVIELTVGFAVHSLALMADAFHMVCFTPRDSQVFPLAAGFGWLILGHA